MTKIVRTKTRAEGGLTPEEEKLMAYHAQSDWNEAHEIYFSKSNIEARRWYADEHCDGELGGIDCKRCQWADQYYPGPIPIKAYIDQGWWFECQHCYDAVSSDYFEPVYEGTNWVFCNQKCRDDFHAKKRRVGIIEKYALKAFREKLVKKLNGFEPTIIKEHCYVRRQKTGRLGIVQIYINFDFPGRKYSYADYRIDNRKEEPKIMCANGDQETFAGWLDQLEKGGVK